MRRLSLTLRVLLVGAALLGDVGCKRIEVNKNWAREGIVLGMEDSGRSNQLSRNSLEVLYRENLLETYSQDPKKAYENLLAEILRDPEKQEDPMRLFAAAELANVLAERDAPPWNRRPFVHPRGSKAVHASIAPTQMLRFLEKSRDLLLYYAMASYLSYAYLARASLDLEKAAYNPQFRQACEIYNYSLEQSIRFTLDAAPFNPQSFYRLGNPNEAVKARFEMIGFDWTYDDIHEILPAEDFQSEEIGPSSRWKGLGVPLIGIRYRTPEDPQTYYPKVCAFPMTAVYIPQEEFNLEETESREIIYLVNPWTKETLSVGQSQIPIEADLSTPLNYMLKETGFNSQRWEGFVGKNQDFKGNVFLFQPHRKGRIPVVLCHGLLSSPEPWESLVNGLMSDPWVRRNYEFWFMQYPTGTGLLANAADLRQALTSIRDDLDPRHEDPALDRMVLIGHSMGGLLANLLSHDSGPVFWDGSWSAPLDRLDVTQEEKEELRRIFFFERLPFVERVIFVASPHKGSPFASRPVGWLGDRFAKLPKDLMSTAASVSQRNAQYAKEDFEAMTSIRQLREDSSILKQMAALNHPTDSVHFHNILGDLASEDEAGTDGVVPVESGTLDWVESGLVVPARHTQIQRHPLTITEIHRILELHNPSGQAGPGRLEDATLEDTLLTPTREEVEESLNLQDPKAAPPQSIPEEAVEEAPVGAPFESSGIPEIGWEESTQ